MSTEDFSHIVSRTYRPNPEMACEACIFGRGSHSPWCEKATPSQQQNGPKVAEPQPLML